jgi:DNA polymerase-3 subunit alpha
MAALLTSIRDDKDKSALYLNECRRMGIRVLLPDVNASASDYTPIDGDIRFGLTAIRNVGENVVESITANRESKGKFVSFGDFLSKVDQHVCNKKTIESLIKGGAFDSLGSSRRGLMMIYLEAIDSITEVKRAEAIGQFDLFGSASAPSENEISENESVKFDIPEGEWDKNLLLAYEREMLGLYVSDHPLFGVEHILRAAVDMPLSQVKEDSVGHDQVIRLGGLITQVQRKISRQGTSWAIVSIEDLEGAVDISFYANTYQAHAMDMLEDRLVVIRARVDRREETLRISALELTTLDVATGPIGPLVISIDSARVTAPLVDRMKEILRSHPGTREVHLRLDDGAKGLVMKIDDELRVTSSPSLSADLKSVLGPDCLVS